MTRALTYQISHSIALQNEVVCTFITQSFDRERSPIWVAISGSSVVPRHGGLVTFILFWTLTAMRYAKKGESGLKSDVFLDFGVKNRSIRGLPASHSPRSNSAAATPPGPILRLSWTHYIPNGTRGWGLSSRRSQKLMSESEHRQLLIYTTSHTEQMSSLWEGFNKT